MLSVFDSLRDVTLVSVTLRMVLAVICGGAIGLEREYKRRSAGFRTHILICLGAAMTTLTSEFLFLNMHYYLDIARMGASVAAGMGFIGAGTIIVTHRWRVKGLTTAAGLWTAAIIGLALGAGFYEGGLFATGLLLLAELLFSRLEYRLLSQAPVVNFYTEYRGRESLDTLLDVIRDAGAKVLNLEITQAPGAFTASSSALFTLRLARRENAEALLARLRAADGVQFVEEL